MSQPPPEMQPTTERPTPTQQPAGDRPNANAGDNTNQDRPPAGNATRDQVRQPNFGERDLREQRNGDRPRNEVTPEQLFGNRVRDLARQPFGDRPRNDDPREQRNGEQGRQQQPNEDRPKNDANPEQLFGNRMRDPARQPFGDRPRNDDPREQRNGDRAAQEQIPGNKTRDQVMQQSDDVLALLNKTNDTSQQPKQFTLDLNKDGAVVKKPNVVLQQVAAARKTISNVKGFLTFERTKLGLGLFFLLIHVITGIIAYFALKYPDFSLPPGVQNNVA